MAVVEIFASGRPWFAAVLAMLLAGGYVGLVVQARRMGHWANTKTLELSFWLPDIDDKFTEREPEHEPEPEPEPEPTG